MLDDELGVSARACLRAASRLTSPPRRAAKKRHNPGPVIVCMLLCMLLCLLPLFILAVGHTWSLLANDLTMPNFFSHSSGDSMSAFGFCCLLSACGGCFVCVFLGPRLPFRSYACYWYHCGAAIDARGNERVSARTLAGAGVDNHGRYIATCCRLSREHTC
jgi:hypothetical protein